MLESVTLPPAQKVTTPLAVITGVAGIPLPTELLIKPIAPAVESVLPDTDAPRPKLIAPLMRAVPLKEELMPKDNAPPICQ